MKFRHIEDKSDLIGGYCYILAFRDEYGKVVSETDHTYLYAYFESIDSMDGTVSVEDDDRDYAGFAYLESYREDGVLKFIWKKVTNAVAYARIPIILYDEDYEKE